MTLVLIVALIAATAIVITVFPAMRRSLRGRRLSAPRLSGVTVRSGSRGRPLVGADAPTLVGADASAGMGEDSLVVMRVDTPRPAGNGSSGARGDHLSEGHRAERVPRLVGEQRPIPVRGGDQRSALFRRAEQRESLRPPDAGEVEDPSEMERQVRDQLYGPGFRRR
jgi:hypothetical protein